MAIMNFSFQTNLPSSEDKTTPTVDYIYICDKERKHSFSFGCSRDSNYGIGDGVYEARFKGVDIDKDGAFIEVDEGDIKALRKMLLESEPEVEMQICLWDEEYPCLDGLEVTNLKICLEAENEALNAELDTPTVLLV